MIIGVDHDNKSFKQLSTSLKIAKKLGRVDIFQSPRRKGFHFVIHLDHPIGIVEHYNLRMKLGDDQNRLDAELPEVNDFLFSARVSKGSIFRRKYISENEFIRIIGGDANE